MAVATCRYEDAFEDYWAILPAPLISDNHISRREECLTFIIEESIAATPNGPKIGAAVLQDPYRRDAR